MGRTPNYNAGNGKDHWSIGSAMFLGRGIKGNRVIGATDEKQFTVPVDPQTLKLDKDKGIRVHPEHVHESLRVAGIIGPSTEQRVSPWVDLEGETPRILGLAAELVLLHAEHRSPCCRVEGLRNFRKPPPPYNHKRRTGFRSPAMTRVDSLPKLISIRGPRSSGH